MKYQFPKDFMWGASTSGVQTEGTENMANLSIWSHWFKQEPEKFLLNIGPEVVCNTYQKYIEDVKLMKEINFNSFRTSIQWGRLIKDFENNLVDEDAVKFYNNYIDEMISKGIEPIINLYHFDMPEYLQIKYGGFENKKVIELFVKYAEKCFELFGHKVKYFTTFNEPIVPVEGGYFYNFHYPNRIDPQMGIQVGYNTLIAHAKVVNSYRKMKLNGEIGIILNLTPSYPRSNQIEDVKAAKMADLIFNRSYLDPVVKGVIPAELIKLFADNGIKIESTSEELDQLKQAKIDFLGVNYYVPRRVKAKETAVQSYFMPENYFDYHVNLEGRFNKYRDNNEIWPVALYDIAKNIQDNYGNIKWYVAEIGIAMDLESEGEPDNNGIINDQFRTNLLIEHLVELHKAIIEGSNCFGFHMWTFIDCWSWCNSFKRRYGFYRLDLATNERIIKSNALWFSNLAINNEFEI